MILRVILSAKATPEMVDAYNERFFGLVEPSHDLRINKDGEISIDIQPEQLDWARTLSDNFSIYINGWKDAVPEYDKKANQLMKSFSPEIYACKKCGDPAAEGHACTFCGDPNPYWERR